MNSWNKILMFSLWWLCSFLSVSRQVYQTSRSLRLQLRWPTERSLKPLLRQDGTIYQILTELHSHAEFPDRCNASLPDLKLQCDTEIVLGEAESVSSKLRREKECPLFVANKLLFCICNCCELCWPGCTQVHLWVVNHSPIVTHSLIQVNT